MKVRSDYARDAKRCFSLVHTADLCAYSIASHHEIGDRGMDVADRFEQWWFVDGILFETIDSEGGRWTEC